VVFKYLYQ